MVDPGFQPYLRGAPDSSGAREERPQPAIDRRLYGLVSLGIVQSVAYGVFTWLSPRFALEVPPVERPILETLSILGGAFGGYLVSVAIVYRSTSATRASDNRQLTAVIVFAAVFRGLAWWAEPFQEVDYYRYIWDGRVLAAGMNPYHFAPAEIDKFGDRADAPDELRNLRALSAQTPALKTIFARIDHRAVPTVYPPTSQFVFLFAVRLTPIDASVAAHVRVMKAVMASFDLAVVGMVTLLLSLLGYRRALVITYAWCPLVVKEFANTGHMDVVAVLATVLAVYLHLLTRDECAAPRTRGIAAAGSAVGSGLILAFAITSKGYAVILIPLFVVYWYRRLFWRCLAPLVVCLATVLAQFAMFASPVDRPQVDWRKADSAAGGLPPEHGPTSGLREFLSRWEMNDLLFAVVVENLRDPDAAPADPSDRLPREPWFLCLPETWRRRWNDRAFTAVERFTADAASIDLAFMSARSICGVVIAGLAIVLPLARWRDDERLVFVRRTFWLLAIAWYLLPAQNPWYWTWALPFVAFARWPWLLTSGLALLYYTRFWLDYQFPAGPILGTPYTGAEFFDFVVVWIEHAPVLFLAAMVDLRRRFARANQPERC